MVPENQVITVAGVNVARDQAGRFCLNDLHKAAGAEPRHQPATFFRRPEIAELIEELNSAPAQTLSVETSMGRNGGTYVCKELVYAYAMWISAKFHLEVIRTFDTVSAGAPVAKAKSDSTSMDRNRDARTVNLSAKTAEMICKALPHLGAEAQQVIYAKTVNSAAGTEIVPLPVLANLTYSAGEVGARIGISGNMVGRIAIANGLKTEEFGRYVLDKSAHSDKQVESFRYNEAGVKRVAEILARETAS